MEQFESLEIETVKQMEFRLSNSTEEISAIGEFRSYLKYFFPEIYYNTFHVEYLERSILVSFKDCLTIKKEYIKHLINLLTAKKISWSTIHHTSKISTKTIYMNSA